VAKVLVNYLTLSSPSKMLKNLLRKKQT